MLRRPYLLPRYVVEQPEVDLIFEVTHGVNHEIPVEATDDVSEVDRQGGGDKKIVLIVDRLDGRIRLDVESPNASRDQRVQRLGLRRSLKRLVARQVRDTVSNYGRRTIRQVKIAAPVSVIAIVKCPPCGAGNVH